MTRFLLPALFVALTATTVAAQGTLDGHWLTQDKRAIVEVAQCGAKECGKIVWVKDPISPTTGKPRRDKNNPDAGLQSRPIIGLATLSQIVPNADGEWDAVSYDPRNGETHDITVRVNTKGNKIELKGCALGGLVCRSEIWTKAPDQLPDDQTQQQTSN
jgi:uncharacterized protein (DUF2147 family)